PARPFCTTHSLDRIRTFDGDRDQTSHCIQGLSGETAGNADGPDSPHAHFQWCETQISLAIHYWLAARNYELELLDIEAWYFDAGTIDVSWFGQINCRREHAERVNHVLRNGVQQVQNIVRRK